MEVNSLSSSAGYAVSANLSRNQLSLLEQTLQKQQVVQQQVSQTSNVQNDASVAAAGSAGVSDNEAAEQTVKPTVNMEGQVVGTRVNTTA